MEAEPLEPLPPRHGEDELWTSEPKPVCSVCGGLMRRRDAELVCDLHGAVAVEQWYPEDE